MSCGSTAQNFRRAVQDAEHVDVCRLVVEGQACICDSRQCIVDESLWCRLVGIISVEFALAKSFVNLSRV